MQTLLVGDDHAHDLFLLTQFFFVELGVAGFRRIATDNQVADHRVVEVESAQLFNSFLSFTFIKMW